MTHIPTHGEIIQEGGQSIFTGPDGKGLEWEKQKDGSSFCECTVPLAFEKGKVKGEVKYRYTLKPHGGTPEVGLLQVIVEKGKVEEKSKEKETTTASLKATQPTKAQEREIERLDAAKKSKNK